MSRPSLLVRVAGSPLPAFLLFVVYAVVFIGWCQGDVEWWLGLAAIAAAMRTLSAIRTVRRYKAWVAEWNAMGEPERPRPKEKRGGRRRVFITVLVLLLLANLARLAALPGNDGTRTGPATLSIVLGTCLVAVLLRGRTRRIAKRRKAEPEAVSIPVVEWMLGRASSSPSRGEAARKLPEYCARLLSS